tara:strand:+ start:780 stop:1046 length:267 start_codon:yes stop_codon:yes gene_type:complete
LGVALLTSLPLLWDGVIPTGVNPAFSFFPPPLPLGLVLLADSQLTMLLSPSVVLESEVLESEVLESEVLEEVAAEQEAVAQQYRYLQE